MPDRLLYRSVHADEPIERVARLTGLAFGFDDENALTWLRDSVGAENFRVLDDGDALQACACRMPFGIFLAGRSVPQLGIVGVAVAPEKRGAGLATRLMTECVREMHADGYALSTLFSAMHALYRRVGYENAGVLTEAAFPPDMLVPPAPEPGGDTPRWRQATEDDLPAIRACYDAYARGQHGMLDRSAYLWKRITHSRIGTTRWFLAEDSAGRVEAYCFYVQKPSDRSGDILGNHPGATLHVTDCAWSTPRGFDCLRRFLRHFASLAGLVHARLPLATPLVLTLPDRRFAHAIHEPFMLRILDARRALESRGYLPGIDLSLTLDLTDDIIESNNGRWTLRVREGRAEVEPAGPDTDPGDVLACHVRDLAPIYTGHLTAAVLRGIGRASCSDRTAALAAAAFAGATPPSMTDMF